MHYLFISNTRIEKNREEITKAKSYRLQFIDNVRFMARWLPNPVHNLPEEIHKIKLKYENDNKICETLRIKYKGCDCFLEYINFKNDLIGYKCLYCNKNC